MSRHPNVFVSVENKGGINIAQGNINITLGCDYLKDNGHIDINAGIFGVLTEELKQVHKGIILPAINNTSCSHRRTKHCNVNCHKAVTVYQTGHHWSPLTKGRRM